jgi:hypothetical protein
MAVDVGGDISTGDVELQYCTPAARCISMRADR